MKKLAAIFWISASLCFGPAGAMAAGEQKRGVIKGGVAHAAPDWFKESFLDIQEDVDEATAADKHVLLFFQLNGCPYCDRMLREAFETDPLMSYIRQHFDVIAINVRGDREIAFNEDTSVSEKQLSELLKVRATPGIMFLNADNKPVVRVDGYRAPERFEHILHYVSSKAYRQQTLASYLDEHLNEPVYSLRDDPMFRDTADLSGVQGPLAIIFEDSRCHDCEEFHDRLLADPAVRKELQAFTMVRLDADTTTDIIDPAGNKTSPKVWAEQLGMTYRPGVVLYVDGKLLRRYDSLLFVHHFKEGLRWIGSGAYKQEDYESYSARRTEELLAAGIDIDLGR